jgi:hypothetical protein
MNLAEQGTREDAILSSASLGKASCGLGGVLVTYCQ